MHAPVFIRSFSRNDKFASFHFLNHFKNNILLFVLTRKRVPSFRENHFLMGKGRPAAVPFPASSSLTPHHFCPQVPCWDPWKHRRHPPCVLNLRRCCAGSVIQFRKRMSSTDLSRPDPPHNGIQMHGPVKTGRRPAEICGT